MRCEAWTVVVKILGLEGVLGHLQLVLGARALPFCRFHR